MKLPRKTWGMEQISVDSEDLKTYRPKEKVKAVVFQRHILRDSFMNASRYV